MIDNFILIVLKLKWILPVIATGLCVTKVILFNKNRSKRWTGYSLLYFSQMEIMDSNSQRSAFQKKLQNKLSNLLAAVVLGYVVVMFISISLSLH